MELQKKSYWRTKINILSSLLLILSLAACNAKSCSKTKRPSPNDPQNTSGVVVLNHGFNDADGLDKLKTKLEADLKDKGVKVVVIKRTNTQNASITDQGDFVYQELEKQGLNKQKMVLFGDSQGGLVSMQQWIKHRNDLNLKGIITNHTPLKGVPVIDNQQEISKLLLAVDDLANNLSVAQKAGKLPGKLQLVEHSLSKFGALIKGQIQGAMQGVAAGKGAQDMKPNGAYIKNIESELQKIDIPVLILAGEVENFAGCLNDMVGKLMGGFSLFSFPNELNSYLSGLKNAWAGLIGDAQHDMLVPLDSQLANSSRWATSSLVTRKVWENYNHYVTIEEEEQVYAEILGAVKEWLEVE